MTAEAEAGATPPRAKDPPSLLGEHGRASGTGTGPRLQDSKAASLLPHASAPAVMRWSQEQTHTAAGHGTAEGQLRGSEGNRDSEGRRLAPGQTPHRHRQDQHPAPLPPNSGGLPVTVTSSAPQP